MTENALREIAAFSGGKYYNLGTDADVFNKIYTEILKMEQKDIRSHEYSDYQERYQLILALGIGLFLISLLLSEKGPGSPESED